MAYDNPHGFVPFDPITEHGTQKFRVTSSTRVNVGDLVTLTSGRLAIAVANSGNVIGVALEAVTAGDAANDGSFELLVCIDPDMRYTVQADDANVAVTQVGTTFAPIITAGATNSIYSAHELDGSSSATSGEMLILLGIVAGPQIGGGKLPGFSVANTECLVKINPELNGLVDPARTYGA